ncbi:MAG TPA: D-aminoacylase, partial [Blastocatellia bacterium]|nr:D-aminoacylase [Blastocatellia bacterium]
ADTFQLNGYGYLRDGVRANLVVFDEEQVADTATFEDSTQYPKGIELVLVGGQIVIEGDRQHEPRHGVRTGLRS